MLRLKDLEFLKLFLKNPNISYSEISKELNVKDRTMRGYLHRINAFLREHNNGKIVKNGNFLTLEGCDVRKLISAVGETNILSPEERRIIIMILICTKKYFSLTVAAKIINVSRVTVKNDFEEINKTYKLSFDYLFGKGYKLNVSHSKTMNLYINFLCQYIPYMDRHELPFEKKVSKILNEAVPAGMRKNIIHAISEIQNKLDIKLTDKIFNSFFSLFICFMRHQMPEMPDYFIKNSSEYAIVESAALKVHKFSQAHITLLTDYIMGVQLYHDSKTKITHWLHTEVLVKHMIRRFRQYSGMNLSHDNTLFEFLICHIKPTIYRIKKGIKLDDAFTKEVAVKSDPIFKTISLVVQDIEEMLGVKFPKEEQALLAYHFKASLERNNLQKTKKILVVCGYGQGRARLLERNIKENYDVDIADIIPVYMLKSIIGSISGIDLILSTTDLNERYPVPVATVEPFLTQENMRMLDAMGLARNCQRITLSSLVDVLKRHCIIRDEKAMAAEFQEKFGSRIINDLYKNTLDLIKPENIRIIERVHSWEDAIKHAGDILLEAGAIRDAYVDEMTETVRKYGSYIVVEDGIAVPHGSAISALRFEIGVLVIKEAVNFPKDKGVNILFAFSVKDKDHFTAETNALFELVSRKMLRERLLECDTPADVMNVIKGRSE